MGLSHRRVAAGEIRLDDKIAIPAMAMSWKLLYIERTGSSPYVVSHPLSFPGILQIISGGVEREV
jgi:hypothetical protein